MHEENLITKKELLAITGISYGALYRWKRKRLIPDAWFIHRSTYTGQETFFPRQKILDRIAFIQRHKDTHSLDDIASMLYATPKDSTYDEAAIVQASLMTSDTLFQLLSLCHWTLPLSYSQLLTLYLTEQIAQSANIDQATAYQGAALLEPLLQSGEWTLYCIGIGQSVLFMATEQHQPPHLAGHQRMMSLNPTVWIHTFDRSLAHE